MIGHILESFKPKLYIFCKAKIEKSRLFSLYLFRTKIKKNIFLFSLFSHFPISILSPGFSSVKSNKTTLVVSLFVSLPFLDLPSRLPSSDTPMRKFSTGSTWPAFTAHP